MNVAALRRGVRKAEAAVEALNVFEMSYFEAKVSPHGRLYFPNDDVEGVDICGTACCLAGYTLNQKELVVARKSSDMKIYSDLAAKKLGLPMKDNPNIFSNSYYPKGDAWRLFDLHAWPQEFKNAYMEIDRQVSIKRLRPCTKRRLKYERAKIAVLKARVEHFIATKGE